MAEQKTIKMINGIDTEVMRNVMQSVQEDPSMAKSNLRIRNRWINGSHNQSTISDFYAAGQDNPHEKRFVVDADEPPLLAGGDQAAGPMEYLLHALASCLTSTLVYQAALRGIEIQEIESYLDGDLDVRGFTGLSEDVRKGFESIRVTFKVKTDEEDMEKLKELVQFSAVLDAVSNATPVDIRFEKK